MITQPFINKSTFLGLRNGLAVNTSYTGGGQNSDSGTVSLTMVKGTEVATHSGGVVTIQENGRYRIHLKLKSRMNASGGSGNGITLHFKKNGSSVAGVSGTTSSVSNTFTNTYTDFVLDGTTVGSTPTTTPGWACNFEYLFEGDLLESDAFRLDWTFNEGSLLNGGYVQIADVELVIEKLT